MSSQAHSNASESEGSHDPPASAASSASVLAGLTVLTSQALVGYDALVEATSKPIVWRWHGIVADNHHAEIAGPSGEGKTTLLTLLLAAMANPTEKVVTVLGREVRPIAPDRFVILVEEENGTHSVRLKMERVCQALDLPVRATIDRMIFLIRKEVRVFSAAWSELEQLGRQGRVGAIVIDTRARVLSLGDASSEENQVRVAGGLTRMVEATKGPVLEFPRIARSGGVSC